MQAPPQGVPDVHIMVGVQVLPEEQGASLPTVQIVPLGVGAEMHWPPHGTLGVETIVGVQVLPEGQGVLFPTVHGMTGGRLAVVKQTPWQAVPV